MRKNLREQLTQTANANGMSRDPRDSLTRESHIENIELAAELGMTHQQVQALKRRLERG
ncbi:hypothetical protein [Effusibacillus consociatus]|uniref:RNA polymerase subunit sigma-70 n=1 Tax=Effusibacillus consociatus TaxID=1117041 RepID=A0ABV9PX53_9BACL